MHFLNRVVFCYLTSLIPIISDAGGFQVNLQGQKQTGMGHCGTSLSLDGSSAFFNPGAFAFLDSNSISLGTSFVMSKVSYLAIYPSVYTSESVSDVATPFTLYSNVRIPRTNRWNLGLAVYTPFGSGIAYKDDWIGQFVLRKMSLRMIFTQPTLGFKINEKIGIGAGFVYGNGKFLMEKAIQVQFQNGDYGSVLLTGMGKGYGFNAGINVKPSEDLSLGLSYRSQLKVDMQEGLAVFDVPAALSDSFPQTNFTTSITLPDVISAGVSYYLNEKLLLAFDYNYVGWKIYDTLAFDFELNTENLQDVASARKYQNNMIFRIGTQIELSNDLFIRAGVYYDITPVKEGYLTPETPDNNKLGITAGWTWQWTNRLQLNTSFLYIHTQPRTDINLETAFGGTWQDKAFIPGLGLEYTF